MPAGETLCLAQGSYTNLDLTFGGAGSEQNPITIAAEIPGTVSIDGEIFIGMTGQLCSASRFHF